MKNENISDCFCGKFPTIIEITEDKKMVIRCQKCQTRTSPNQTEGEAIKEWNFIQRIRAKMKLNENRDRFIKIQDAEVCLAESPDLASLVCSFGSYPPSMRKEALRKIASFCVGFVEEKLKDGVR
jgi:hypothetical protein